MQTQDSLNFSRIFSRIDKVMERCNALEREDAFRVETSGSRLISSDIAQIRSDASRLDDADLRRTATAMSYVLESRANYGMAVAKTEYVTVAREATKRDGYLNEARTAANTALGYEKLPLAYFTLGMVLVASGHKSDATIAFQQVIESRDSDLTPHALEAIRQIGTSSRLSKRKASTLWSKIIATLDRLDQEELDMHISSLAQREESLQKWNSTNDVEHFIRFNHADDTLKGATYFYKIKKWFSYFITCFFLKIIATIFPNTSHFIWILLIIFFIFSILSAFLGILRIIRRFIRNINN